jgi:glycosyltransferase involved in cell wall biosynthesis
VVAQRVVLLMPRLSAQPRSGGELRSLRIAQSLAQRSRLTIVVVGPPVDTDALAAATGADDVRWFPGRTGLGGRLLAAVRRWPLAVARGWNPRARDLVRGEIAGGARVVCDFLDPAALVDRDAELVLNLHNVEADLAALAGLGRGWRGWEQRVERARMRRWERDVVNRPRVHVVVPSQREADSLSVVAEVVGNGTDVPRSPAAIPSDGTVLFVGALDYPPNADALGWWLADIAPRLDDPALPALTVVGRGHEEFARTHATATRIDLVGPVDDVLPWIAAATISVVPVRHGGGTRIKVLEALANGRAVVTTSKGAEGLPVVDGVHARIADTPAEFAAAVEQLWHDGEQRARLAAAGHELSLDFDWRRLGSRFADIVLDIKPGSSAEPG